MRWKTAAKNKHGDKRIEQRFAFLPTELDDGYTVWLEPYYALEQWYENNTDTAMSHWRIVKTSIAHPDNPGTGTSK